MLVSFLCLLLQFRTCQTAGVNPVPRMEGFGLVKEGRRRQNFRNKTMELPKGYEARILLD